MRTDRGFVTVVLNFLFSEPVKSVALLLIHKSVEKAR
jgi:hypothetical protein